MKILYVTTISNTVNAFLIPHIEMLVDKGHQVDVAFNIEQEIKQEIYKMGCKVHEIKFNRILFRNNFIKIIKKLKKIILTEQYDVIHTHTPIASAIVRVVCRKINNVKVVYTAHGFHFYKGAPIKNWLVYYPIEKKLSKYTDVLITINQEDYKRAQNFSAKQVEYIPGTGIEVEKFSGLEIDVTKKRRQLNIPQNSSIITSVGELNNNKNHQTIIKSLSKLNDINVHYIICGEGNTKEKIKKLAKKFNIEEKIHLLGYRTDIHEILAISDALIFPSKREGLGLAAIEAMAVGLPILTSNIHGIKDYSMDGVTGFNYSPTNVNGFSKGIEKILSLTEQEKEKISSHNKKIANKYDIKIVKNNLEKIYKFLCN